LPRLASLKSAGNGNLEGIIDLTPKSRSNPARCLAVLGTGSEVGKSVIATALCRALANRGLKTAPFKAQNMSNNSGVTPDGLEMGRAQIVQAEAARTVPHVDMNPVLLKPTAGAGSQIVLLGKAIGNRNAVDPPALRERLFAAASQACDRLRREYEAVVLEGAGSCAEVNLMAGDYVNFRMAAHAGAPAVIVADIDRGGVFAQIVGTMACLPPEHRGRVGGFIVNRFRGDLDLFGDGIRWIEETTGKPVYGTLPWFDHIHIEPEDSAVLENLATTHPEGSGTPAIAVIRLPHISNFNDFEPLRRLSGLKVCYLQQVRGLAAFRAVILPGSKNTRWDLDWLRRTGWEAEIIAYTAGGGHLLGICGGYQMLGKTVQDPEGLEGRPGGSTGLGLLPVETTLKAPKTTTLTRFSWGPAEGMGYEIHMGRTDRGGGDFLFGVIARNRDRSPDTDGCNSADGRVMGTYIHGLFDSPAVTRKWLNHIGLEAVQVPSRGGLESRDEQYDLLAAHFERHVRVEEIVDLLQNANG